jgi:nicotinamidase-related amidase
MTTGLLILDAQKVYTDPDSELYCQDSKATIGHISDLINHFRQQNNPIFYVRHIHKIDGSDLGRLFDYTGEPGEDFNFKEGTNEIEYDDNLLKPNGDSELIKTRYSAFSKTDLDERLHAADVDRVVICGFMTNFCCESTARDALDRDYYVDFILDATGSPGTESMDEEEIRKVVGELLEAGFARVFSTEEYCQL